MTTEQQDTVDDERREQGQNVEACSNPECSLERGHAGPCDGRRPASEEEGPVRERCATEPVHDAPDPGMGLAAFVLDVAHEANRDRGPGDADAWYALGRLYQEAIRYHQEHGKMRGAKLPVGPPEPLTPYEESAPSVPWWRTEPRESTVVAPVPVQRDVAKALAEEFGNVPLSARLRIARAMLPLLEAAANDGAPHRPPGTEPEPHPLAPEPFHPDGDRAARGDDGPTAADLEAWSNLRPGDVLGNVHKTASLDDPAHGQTWLELMVGWDESGPVPVPVVFVIRFGAGQWNPPEKWQPRHLLPGHRRRVLHAPDLSSAPLALRRLVYPHMAAGALVLGPETLAGPERVGELQHPRIIMHRGATYVLADDAPAVPGANVQTLRAAWVAGEDELTARIGDTTYVKVRPVAEGGTVTARVPGEPRMSLFPACGFRVATAGVACGPCQRPSGHASAHQDIDGRPFDSQGWTSGF